MTGGGRRVSPLRDTDERDVVPETAGEVGSPGRRLRESAVLHGHGRDVVLEEGVQGGPRRTPQTDDGPGDSPCTSRVHPPYQEWPSRPQGGRGSPRSSDPPAPDRSVNHAGGVDAG